MTKEILLQPRELLTESDVKQFFSDCIDFLDGGFHIDTQAGEYVDTNDLPTFTPDEAREFDRLMDLAVVIVDDPYQIAVSIMHARGHMTIKAIDAYE